MQVKKKALYGLKHAPRAWFKRLSDFLLQQGFINSKSDPSLFVYHKGNTLRYLLIYDDDFILTGIYPALIKHFISRLNKEFVVKDLELLCFFRT